MATTSTNAQTLSSPETANKIARVVSGGTSSGGLGQSARQPQIGTPEWQQANEAARDAVYAKNRASMAAGPTIPGVQNALSAPAVVTSAPASVSYPAQPAGSGLPPIGSATYTGEVANRVNYLLNSDSPLMKRAATTGLQVASRRGLGNSTMAVGEAQKAVIDAATPIASQDSAQENQRTITSMNNASAERVAQMQIDAAAALAERESDLKLTLANIERDTSLTLQEKKAAADKELAAFNAEKQQVLAELDAATRTSIADKEINANRGLAEFNAAQEAERQARSIEANSSLADKNIAADQARLATTIAADDARTDKTLAAQASEGAASRAAAQQQQLAQALSDMSSQRFQALSQTLANSKIKADARGQIVSSINDQYASTVGYLQNLYGVTLSDAQPTTAGLGR